MSDRSTPPPRPLTPSGLERITPLAGSDPSPVGLVVEARYEILKSVARGGMGEVFLARDLRLDRPVAMKVLAPELPPTAEDRLRAEIRTMSEIEHPGIVAVHDVGRMTDGRLFFTMKFVEGRTLEEKRPLPELIGILADVCDVVHFAHERGVLHRDLKPANLMVDRDRHAYVMDWGLARVLEGAAPTSPSLARTQDGTVLGTVQYMAPEQARGEVAEIDRRSDLFSLGAILYEGICGKPPATGANYGEALESARAGRYPSPRERFPHVSPDLDAVCRKAIAAKKGDRYPTVAAFAKDLRRYLRGDPVAARPLSMSARWWRKGVRHRALVVPALAAMLLGIGFGVWAISSSIRKSVRVRRILSKAQEYERQGAILQARDEFRAAMEMDPDNREARVAWERNEAELNRRTAEAAAKSREALKMLEAGRIALDRAVRLLSRADATPEEFFRLVGEAQRPAEEAVALAPNLASGHYLLGVCWDLSDREDRAEACWRRALEIDPQFGPAHYRLGRSYLVRSWLESLGATSRDVLAHQWAAVPIARRAREELEAAVRDTSGFDDALQREIVELTLAFLTLDRKAFEERLKQAVDDQRGKEGVEDLHWLAHLTKSGKEALHHCERILRTRPKDVLALFSRGVHRYRGKNLWGAIADFDEVLRFRPHFAEGYCNRGLAKADRMDWTAAIADYTAALALNPQLAWAYSNRGAARANSGDWAGAIADYEAALQCRLEEPHLEEYLRDLRSKVEKSDHANRELDREIQRNSTAAMPYYNRGVAREALRDFARAIADYSEALKLDPRMSRAWFNRGRLRQEQKDFDGALRDYTEALAIDPNYAKACLNRGVVRLERGDFAGAVDDYTEAIRSEPKWVEAYVNRAVARERLGAREEAIADYSEAVRLDPKNLTALIYRGRLRHAMGRSAEALQDFDAAILAAPERSEPYLERSIVPAARGAWDEVIADCTEAIRRSPDSAIAFLSRGIAQSRRGRWTEAADDFTEAISHDSNLVVAYYNRAVAREKLGKTSEAVEDCTELVRLEPDKPAHLLMRAHLHGKRKEWDAVVADSSEAIRLDPKSADGYRYRGAARGMINDPAGAVADLERALEVAPQDWSRRSATQVQLEGLRKLLADTPK